MATSPPDGIAAFLDRYGDESAEVAWLAGLAWLDRAAMGAREGKWGRFRHFPSGELRRLRRDVAGALMLCRYAVALQEEENGRMRELTSDLHDQAAKSAAARRRDGTREAERVRLVRAKARREGRAPTDAELYGRGE